MPENLETAVIFYELFSFIVCRVLKRISVGVRARGQTQWDDAGVFWSDARLLDKQTARNASLFYINDPTSSNDRHPLHSETPSIFEPSLTWAES